MPYGLKVYNIDNEVQIDGVYKNLSFQEEGSWGVNSLTGVWKSFNPISSAPIIGIQPPSIYCFGISLQKDSNGDYYQHRIASNGSITLPYIIFSEPDFSEIPSNSWGISVYNQSGDLVFHSSKKWLKVISNFIFATPTVFDGTATISVEDADNNYFLLRPGGYAIDYNAGQNLSHSYLLMMKKVDVFTIEIGWVQINTRSGNFTDENYRPSNNTLIEISA